jgi:hypothetical protein
MVLTSSGMIMSDWTGTYSTSEAIKAGLDLEMPYVLSLLTVNASRTTFVNRGPSLMRGLVLQRQFSAGKVSLSEIDSCVRRVCDRYIGSDIIILIFSSGIESHEKRIVFGNPFQCRRKIY